MSWTEVGKKEEMLGFPGDSDSKESTCNVGDQSVEEKKSTKKNNTVFLFVKLFFTFLSL